MALQALKYQLLELDDDIKVWIDKIEEIQRIDADPPSKPLPPQLTALHPGLRLLLQEARRLRENRRRVLLQQLENRFLDIVRPTMASDLFLEPVPDVIQLPLLVKEVKRIEEVAALKARSGYVVIWAEENGTLTAGNYEWSFGNGTENQSRYGLCLPMACKVVAASLSVTASNAVSGHLTVRPVVNGTELPRDISKSTNVWGEVTDFSQQPILLNAGDILNFRSKTTNGSVTHAIVALLIDVY